MKFGVLFNKGNKNIGDDIQAYATARFLPSIDYFVDRENLDKFKTDNNESVAVIMSAWYMWAKWNWPPSEYIYPHFVGFHYADHQLAKQPGSGAKYEFLEGIGGDYLKAYGPIGCRDNFTKEQLSKLGIESFYSGCITLTLPKQPETADKNTYICIVDVDKRVKKKIKEKLENEDIEIREFSQSREKNDEISWEDRMAIVKERLTVYQNARCVVTKRLHVALPCLAMGVPVFLVKVMEDDIRFDPYYDYLHRATVDEYLEDKKDYDFMNPPENKDLYVPVRESLIKSCQEFVEKAKDLEGKPETLVRTEYTEEQVKQWRYETMERVLNNTLEVQREIYAENLELLREERKEKNKLNKKIDKLKNKGIKQKEKIKKLKNKIEELKEKQN